MIRLTTLDLIADVRSLIDETSQDAADDTLDILAALNRAQAEAVTIICSQYDQLIVASKLYTLADVTTATGSVPMPEDILEDRIQKVEVKAAGGYWVSLQCMSYRDAARLETPYTASYTQSYYTQGRRIFLLPQNVASTNFTSLRVWYSKEPDKLVKPLGTVTAVSSSAVPYVHITDDSVEFTASPVANASYVNIVDGETGTVKATLQIASKIADKLTFRTVPQRTSIFGRTVSTALPVVDVANPDAAIKPDDLVCSAGGSCVPFLKGVFVNFLVQSAALDCKRRLGDAETLPVELQLKDNFLQYVKGLWSGREQGERIRPKSDAWLSDDLKRKTRRLRR